MNKEGLELAAIRSQLKIRKDSQNPYSHDASNVMMECEDGWAVLIEGRLAIVKWGGRVETGTYESPDGGSRIDSYVEYEVIREPWDWEAEMFFSLTEREKELCAGTAELTEK